MDFTEKTLKKEVLYKGKILNLRKDEVVLPDGKRSSREIVEHDGGACVYCERDDKVLMVRQYRYAYGENVLEIPAGKINAGENPEQTAKRELEEEGGIVANELELLFTLYPSPGYTDEKIYVYRVANIVDGEQRLDDGEFLSAEWIDKSELKAMTARGEIKDAKTLVALLANL